MLTLWEGGLFSVAYEDMKKEIYDLAEKGLGIFLIVPEQQAVTAEREFVKLLPKNAPGSFEVTNFSRLANTASRIMGGLAAENLTPGKEALIMWKTLKELSPYLKMTEGCSEINPGLVSRALSAVGEMKNLSVTPDMISEASVSEEIKGEGRLCEKLSDLSKIMELFTNLTSRKYADPKDECEKLSKLLSDNKSLFADTRFYISGFTSFTVPQIKVLTELMRRTDVSVHLTISKRSRDFFEFSEISTTRSELILASDRAGSSKRAEAREAIKQSANTEIAEITDLLWRNFGKIDNDHLQKKENAVKIFEAQDPYEAAMFIAADIKQAVMAGAKFSDFAIISRDGDRYAEILNSYFADADVPCFISRKTDISQYEAIKLIYTAFSIIRSGFAREDVLTYAKSRLSGIDTDACDEFELYCELWQIDKEQFTQSRDWDRSPKGYDSRISDDHTEFLARINKTRHTLIDPLILFSRALSKANTVREYASALVDFLSRISLEKRIADKRSELFTLGEHDAAGENALLWKTICKALDAMVEVLGDTEIDTYDFENQLKAVLGEANIGKLPTYRDVVTVGTADMTRLSEKEHVYLLGVNTGEFPANPDKSSFFTDKDKLLLSKLGIIRDNSQTPTARELFFFSRAMSVAKSTVSLIYFTRDASYAPTSPASVIDRIAEITDKKIIPVKISALPILDMIYSPESALAYADHREVRHALAESGYARDVEISDGDIENADSTLALDTKSRLYKDDIALSQTKIDNYLNCPFAYFLSENIRLSKTTRAEFDARNIGNFIHAILEHFFSDLAASGKKSSELTEDEKHQLIKYAAEKYLSEKTGNRLDMDKRTSIFLDRIYKASLPIVDGLCDELENCEFEPKFFELNINKKNASLPSPASFKFDDGTSVSIGGIIDRVDTFVSGDDVYVRVIDYKTGKKVFKPSDIDEGRNLQMFLYLKSLVETDKKDFKKMLGVGEQGKILPAGVIYVKTAMNDLTLPSNDPDEEYAAMLKAQERRGMLLDDPVSIGAMNENYIPVKMKAGKPASKTENAKLYTNEGWDELNMRISDKIREITDKMRSGDITATPAKDVCEHCKFSNVCRKKSSARKK